MSATTGSSFLCRSWSDSRSLSRLIGCRTHADPGGDYKHFPLPAVTIPASACQAACEKEAHSTPKCVGWTWACPGMQGPKPVRKSASFFEFSLCLSRACLGKMIVLYINGAKIPFFAGLLAQGQNDPALQDGLRDEVILKNRPVFSPPSRNSMNCSDKLGTTI